MDGKIDPRNLSISAIALRFGNLLPSFRGAREREPGISIVNNFEIPGLVLAHHPGMTFQGIS